MVIPSAQVLVQMDLNTSHLIDLIAKYIIFFHYPQYYKVLKLNVPSFLLLDAAQNSMIEATQAYGIEEPSETELQAQVIVATSSLFILYAQLSILITNATNKQQISHKVPLKAYIPKYQLIFSKGR